MRATLVLDAVSGTGALPRDQHAVHQTARATTDPPDNGNYNIAEWQALGTPD
ncbi:MAG: hypothetical protein R6U40_06685 [Desulfobacterales bacterium]